MNLNPRTRRTTAALAAMILVLSLAACGSDEPEVEDPAEGAAEQASGDREDEGGAGETEGDGVVRDTEDEGGVPMVLVKPLKRAVFRRGCRCEPWRRGRRSGGGRGR